MKKIWISSGVERMNSTVPWWRAYGLEARHAGWRRPGPGWRR